jgi:preflagellin peptidase FlaK
MIVELKLLLIGAALAIGSWQDLKTREIDDRLWLVAGIAGGLLTVAEVAMTPSYPLVLAGFSIIMTGVLAFGIYFLGLYGGADAKALLVIALTMPVSTFLASSAFPVFPLSVFGNSLVISLLVIPVCLLVNAYNATRGPLFAGVKASALKKFAALFTGIKVSTETAKSVHFNLIERPLPSGGSELKLFHKVEEVDEPKVFVRGAKSVWVTLAIPMIVFFLGGFILAALGIDILIGIITFLL